MCRSNRQPDGPRTCSTDSRAALASSSTALSSSIAAEAEVDAQLAPPEGMTPLPANPKILIPIPEKSDDPAVYVDPYPSMKGNDRVRVECSECAGTGIYQGVSGISTSDPYVKNGTKKGHFACGGRGFSTIRVSSARASARRRVNAILKHRQQEAEREAELKARAEERAKREQERRATLVQGFVGNPNDKVGGLEGEVTVAKTFESRYGHHTTPKKFLVIKLKDGRVIKTAGSGETLFGRNVGEKVTILSATVKKHDQFNGQDQTELTRVKLLDAPAGSAT